MQVSTSNKHLCCSIRSLKPCMTSFCYGLNSSQKSRLCNPKPSSDTKAALFATALFLNPGSVLFATVLDPKPCFKTLKAQVEETWRPHGLGTLPRPCCNPGSAGGRASKTHTWHPRVLNSFASLCVQVSMSVCMHACMYMYMDMYVYM